MSVLSISRLKTMAASEHFIKHILGLKSKLFYYFRKCCTLLPLLHYKLHKTIALKICSQCLALAKILINKFLLSYNNV